MPLTQIINFIVNSPQQFLVLGLSLSILIILADLKSIVSLSLPGRRRFGLAGLTSLSTAVIYIFVTSGINKILDMIATEIFSAIILGAVLALLFKRGAI